MTNQNDFSELKFALYCRKSSEDSNRQILSLDSQEKEMLALAERLGLKVIETFRESKSAKQPDNRPFFTELVKKIKAGKLDGIICWKIDRLSRNPIDSATIQWLLQQNNLKVIQTMDRLYLPDDNALLFNVESGMANQYILDLSKNVRRGIKAKLELGGWANRAPIGYLNDGKGGIIIDRKRSKYIVRAFDLYATGQHSIQYIADTLLSEGFTSRGGGKYHKSKIHQFLNNSFYCGITEKDGKKYLGNHKPLISKKLFDDVQAVFNRKANIKKQVLPFAFRGILRCSSCGCMLTAVKKKEKHIYYYCTNGKRICAEHKAYITEKTISEELSTIFDNLIFNDKTIELMYLAKLEEGADSCAYLNESIIGLRSKLKGLEERKSAVLNAYLDQVIVRSDYTAKCLEIDNETIELKTDLLALEAQVNSYDESTLERIKTAFLEPKDMKNKFLSADFDIQRNLLFSLLWNAEIGNKKIAHISYKEPYNAMANCANKDDFSLMRRERDLNPRDL